MEAALTALAGVFVWLRWLGVAYLLYLGLTAWNGSTADLMAFGAAPRSRARIFSRAFLVSLTNPKTLLFYGAFLPQFITNAADPGAQLLVLSATFLGLASRQRVGAVGRPVAPVSRRQRPIAPATDRHFVNGKRRFPGPRQNQTLTNPTKKPATL